MKKTIFAILVVLTVISIWYCFIKANDFEVVINSNTSPGTVYHSVLGWNKGLNKSNIHTELIKQHPFSNIVHSYNFDSYNLMMNWEMEKANDTITRVTIGVNDQDHSVKERLYKLLGTSPLEKLLKQEFSGFNTVLADHLSKFRVKIDGIENAPEAYVAYMHIHCHQDDKASNMIRNSTSIKSFLLDQDIPLTSNPFLEIEKWNRYTGNLEYNFCFPIGERIDFPFHESIKYKKVETKKSLKATFHGNYSYTDEAWFVLEESIKKNNYKTLETIIEIFYENPHTTAEKDSNWEAGIYMEIE